MKNKYPDYMRSSVSPQFLAKNPLYRKVFHKCPICSKYSLKPVGIRNVNNIQNMDDNHRSCTLCHYTHIRNLEVETVAKTAIEKAGRILDFKKK